MKKAIVWVGFILLLFPVAFWVSYEYTLRDIPKVSIEYVTPQMLGDAKALPFFELMSPLPMNSQAPALPQLEYIKGPPKRFIEKISLVINPSANGPKERMTYMGRQTQEMKDNRALFLRAAIEFSQTGKVPSYFPISSFNALVKKWRLLNRAHERLQHVEKVYIMDQAEVPAFLYIFAKEAGQPERARMSFYRNNSRFEVYFSADKAFKHIQPLDIFRRSFLVQKRADAQEYLARELSRVRFDQQNTQNLSPQELQWPLALLAANLSIDPASIDAYFHFAGMSALLFKSKSLPAEDIELSDSLRNNVLAADLYAKDVAAGSTKAAEIARLARSLTKTFDSQSD
jgi:hypothetical protein